jgi:triacylglycerol lipase
MGVRTPHVTALLAAVTALVTALIVVPLLGCGSAALAMPGTASPDAAKKPHVVVLHGLGRTSGSMQSLAEHIEDAGFAVHNIGYPSTDEQVDALIAHLAGEIERCCNERDRPLHFVTHSLGGILVRAYIADSRPANLGRVVMLSPPNKGSEIVDTFGDNVLFEWAMGPAGQQLGTDQDSLPNRLGPADFELGIITGSASLNPITSLLVSGDDDGKVSIESAQLAGMADFLIVPKTHTFIMNSDEVASQVIQFLREGRFSRSEATPEE